MRAAYIYEHGPPDVFRIVEVDPPRIKPKDVLVKVEAAGVMFTDVAERAGNYGPPPLGFPYAPGWECAGTVAEVGAEVTGFHVGQRVAGTHPYGCYAEYAAIPARTLRAIPDRASYAQALVYLANLPVAWLHYHVFGQVKPGETILIHGAAGGVGMLLTQLAKKDGCTVIALSSSDEKLAFCKAQGADHLVHYAQVDYAEAVKAITGGQGVDVLFNGVGGETLKKDPKLVKRITGRWDIYGAADGAGPIDAYAFIYDSITVRPSSVLTLEGTEEQKASRRFLDHWLATEPLMEPSHVYKLEDVAAAHELMASKRSMGKIVLTM